MRLKVFFCIIIYWLLIKFGYSPVILYSFIWLLVVIPKFSITKFLTNYTFLHLILILYSLLGYFLGIEYSGEIFISILLLTLPKINISSKDINLSWLIIAVTGFLEFLGFISSDFLQISPDSEYDYFRIQSFLGNPYMNGVFTFFVLCKNLNNKNWFFVLLTLLYSLLLGNRAVIFVNVIYILVSTYKLFNFKYYLLLFLSLMSLVYIGWMTTSDVGWQDFDKPIDRIFSFVYQFDNETATIFLSSEFMKSVEFSFVGFKVLPKNNWLYIYSLSDAMIAYVSYSFGILYVFLYSYVFYKFIILGNYSFKYLIFLSLLALSISDPGIFHPLLVILFLFIL